VRSYESLISIAVHSHGPVVRVSGTCFDGVSPRIVEIDGLAIDLRPAESMLIMKYEDRPGMVGKFGSILGDADINIASMEVGRTVKGADAVVALTLDDPVPPPVKEAIREAINPKELHLVSL
jgi:D-3-phosphoglycerate dehydrogenase